MLCQRCKKNPATVHLTEIVGSEKRESHLCEKCSVQENLVDQGHEPINELLAQFVIAHTGAQELAQLSCQKCGMTFAQFRNGGLLGCPEDYQAFRKPLLALLERVQEGNTEHVGKVPGKKGQKRKRQHKIMQLQRKLKRAVSVEDYETAAALRDQIEAMETK